MPVITINKKDFCQLAGKEFTLKEIEDNMPMLGTGWEGSEGDEFTVEVFPNRPDMLGVEGLARAFSSFMGVRTGLKKYKLEGSEEMVIVENKVAKVRPYFVSCVIKNVKFTDEFIKSIMQIQEKLHITHCRKRKKVAIGLHDYDKIVFPVIYTTKPKDFKFVPLEQNKEMTLQEILEKLPKGKDYAWILEGMEEYPLIHDGREKVLSMPPIINSEDTKVEETTKNIFVDITATDEKTANEVLNIIVTTFADRGATIHKIKIKYPTRMIYTPDLSSKVMVLDPNYINSLLGLKLTNKEIIEYLGRMGHDAEEINKDKIQVSIPCYRTDIMHQIDLVEDVAIGYRYDKFEPEIPSITTTGEEDPEEVFCTTLRSLLVGYGLQETMTFILTNKRNLFNKMNMESRPIAETSNAKTSEYNVVRNWLLPNLMEVLSRNKHNEYPQNLFEVGEVIVLDDNDVGNKTMKRLAITLCHSRANFSEMKSLVESVLANVGVSNYEVQQSKCPCYISGRAAKFTINGRVLARFGEIDPKVLENWGLEMPVVGGEVCVDLLFDIITGKEIVEKVTRYEIKLSEKVDKLKKQKTTKSDTMNEFERIDTERLFYQDPYMKETKAKVTEINGKEVVLDKTLFFAFSGGQASDRGTINEIPVVDAKKENHRIVHVLENKPNFKIGDTVQLKLDWERRYKLMKLHTAAHIVYYPFTEKLGRPKIIGSNINPEKARIDFLYDKPISEVIPEIEKESSQTISQGLEIKTELDKKEVEKRWWRCGKWGMPCGGTHVKNTSEIGKIKLKRKNIGAGKERVEIYLV
ncbi:MAG: phenylalanine--tRNA ligase subunit beta [Candidatus Aenigmarchaeota archaeon]|nr:phenylalanine--tRNA ligase subunit beta [Candidatus Aenigmarchaeota archaeon]